MCSPRSGGGGPDRGRASRTARTGCPTWRTTPRGRVLQLDGHAERDRLGRRERGGDVVDRPGTGSRPRRGAASQSAVVPVGETRRRGSGAGPRGCSTRSPLVANRGSSASSGEPERLAQAAATGARCRRRPRSRRRPSRTSRTGRCSGGRCRAGPGAAPADERVLGLVDEHRQRGSEQRHVDPLAAPASGPRSRSRPTSAARTATAPNSPVTTSLIATPDLGRLAAVRVGAPVIDISPPTAWTTKS